MTAGRDPTAGAHGGERQRERQRPASESHARYVTYGRHVSQAARMEGRGADPYCDPSSPWYNPAYCHWRHRDE